jgi:two-component system cell cycle response regulator
VSSSLAAGLPPRVVNDRNARRNRTLWTGKVVYGPKGESTLDCSIRDFSDRGAKIRLRTGELVPTRLFLIERRAASAFEARVIWIKAPDFGLEFVRCYKLDEPIPADLQFLKCVWELFRVPLGSIT